MIFMKVYFMIWKMKYFGCLVMSKSIFKSYVWCINMCSVLKYFKTMVYVGFMMWDFFLNIHIQNMVFSKPLFYLHFHLMDFIFVFNNVSIFILSHPKNQYVFGRHALGLDNLI